MQPLDAETKTLADDSKCASAVIETVLLGMRVLKASMRDGRPRDLSVPQFRVLAFVRNHRGASLSDAAEYIGLTLPSMSKAVDGLVKRGLLERNPSAEDRRRVTLALTAAGGQVFQAATDATRSRIARMLTDLSPEERSEIAKAAYTLQSLLAEKEGSK